MPDAIEVAQQWDAAAKLDNFAVAIHPTGVDPEAYAASGEAAAAQVREHLTAASEMELLEFGVGNGRVARWLSPPHYVTGADASPTMLDRLAVDAPTVGRWLWNGLDEVASVPPPTFDAIYSFAVFIHLSPGDGVRVMGNLSRMLRPGGLMLLDVPLYDQPRIRGLWCDVTVWTPEMFERAAAACKLDVVEMHADPGTFSFDAPGPNHSRLSVLVRP